MKLTTKGTCTAGMAPTSRDSLQILGRICLLLTVAAVFLSNRAAATTVTVGCAGASGTFNFSTVNDAVNFLAASGKSGHEIDISGTCTETVFLEGWDHVLLAGTSGATIIAPTSLANCAPFSSGCPSAVIAIAESKAITVRGLVLQGAGASGTAPAFVDDSSVNFSLCTFQNGGGSDSGGLFIVGVSRVFAFQSTFQNNQPSGIRIDPGGVFRLFDGSVVQGNGMGIRVFGGNGNVTGSVLIQSNGTGITADAGAVTLFGRPQIISNGFGILLTNGSKLGTGGGMPLIQGNSQFGLLVDASAAVFGSGGTVQQNGTVGSGFSGGILVRNNAHLDIFSGQGSVAVVNNAGPGIIVRNDSSARIEGATITGNSGVGVRIFILSSALVFNDAASHNGGIDLQCSPDSFASGNSSGIQNVFCPHFNVEPLPGP